MGVHHGWGRTYKDLMQRFRAMQGHELRYQNGFDCQGLWVEVEVEKGNGLRSKKDIEDYGLEAVRAAVQGARAALCRRADRAVDPPGLLDGLERPGSAALAGEKLLEDPCR
jgi:isoleucyl-tRNA synthetase